MSQDTFSILLLDDDPMLVRILTRILKDFSPLRFSTSDRGALNLAREDVPDLVLLDVDMPGLSGFATCEAFKSDSALADVPISFLTSHNSAPLEAIGLKLGAAASVDDGAQGIGDVVGLFAGGQFALTLPDTGLTGARTIAQRALNAVAAMQSQHAADAGRASRITLSIGGGSWDCARADSTGHVADAMPNMLIEAAERSVKRARGAGGHQATCVNVCDPEVLSAVPSLH